MLIFLDNRIICAILNKSSGQGVIPYWS